MILETFIQLFRDPAHWQFELLVGFVEMLVFDVLVGTVVWPVIKRHIHRDLKKHNTELDQAYKRGYVQASVDEENMRSGRTRARMIANGEVCDHGVTRSLCAPCRLVLGEDTRG